MRVPVFCSPQETPDTSSPRFKNIDWLKTPPNDPYYLVYQEGKIGLHKKEGPEQPLTLDFEAQWNEWRRQRISPKTDLLARACAVKPGVKILDITMGLANDSLKLVYFGAHVTAVERNPLVYALATDALYESGLEVHLQTFLGHGCEYAETHFTEFDVVYLDPMFYLEKRTALPKKKMQFLSDLLEENTDHQFASTVEFLRKHKKRVVIKRHPDAPSFFGLKPKAIYKGKTIRFEVF